jgi:hypothetical protein
LSEDLSEKSQPVTLSLSKGGWLDDKTLPSMISDAESVIWIGSKAGNCDQDNFQAGELTGSE